MKLFAGRGRRPLLAGLVTVACAGLTVFSASSASAAAAEPNEQDQAYMTANEQTNLAEITLAGIVLDRSSNQQSRDLATMTKADHEAAKAKLQAVADEVGFTLPTEPNADQKAAAAKLSAASDADFDLVYATVQVDGHQKSLAATNLELTDGSYQPLLDYTNGYLPVVTMHLQMAEDLLAALGGSVPDGVPAGSGGAAAVTGDGTVAAQFAVVGVAALLLGYTGLTLSRRRQEARD